jgi:hypothetical protein
MSFDLEKFKSDLNIIANLESCIADPQTPAHHREVYITQLRTHQNAVSKLVDLIESADQMKDALMRIMFDPSVSNYSSNPHYCTYFVAYDALGGKMQAGVQLDDEQSLSIKFDHAYRK